MTRSRALATALSIMLGAVTGAVTGMSGRKPAPSTVIPTHAASAKADEVPPELPPITSASAPAASPSEAISAESEPHGPSPEASPSPARPTIDLTPPATKSDLLSTETRCAREVPEDCERAARALDLGQILPRDAERAQKLRRIALTLYVRQCERSSALACARLAEMHEKGESVFKNPATAKALWSRFQELCTRKPNQPGCASPTSG